MRAGGREAVRAGGREAVSAGGREAVRAGTGRRGRAAAAAIIGPSQLPAEERRVEARRAEGR